MKRDFSTLCLVFVHQALRNAGNAPGAADKSKALRAAARLQEAG